MTIEAGALALRISEVGGDQVLAKLGAIDAKAKALGAGTAVQAVKFNTASATAATTQLGQLSASFTQVEKAATATAPALAKQAAAQAAVAKTAAAVGAETTALARASATFTGVATSLGAVGVVLSAGSILTGIVSLTRDAIDAGDSLHDLAMRTGISVETLSILGPIAEKSGASTETLAVGFRNLSKEVEKLRAGDKGAVATFAAIGLAAKDLEGLSLDQVLIRVANALNQFEDGSFKTAEAVKLFGRAGDQLIPTLHELADGGFERARDRAEALGGVISTDFSDRADRFNDILVDMHTALGGLGRELAEASLPGLTRLAELFTTLIARGRGFVSMIAEAAEKAGLLMLLGPLGPGLIGVGKGANPLDVDKGLEASIKAGNDAIRKLAPRTGGALSATERRALEEQRLERQIAAAMATAGGAGRAGIADIIDRGRPGLVGAPAGRLKGEKPFGLEDAWDDHFKALMDKMERRKEQLKAIATGVATAISGALADGFTSAFKGDEDFFSAFGKALLSSLGNIMVQVGTSMIAYGAILTPLLGITGPFGAIISGAPASLAAGLLLTALGAKMGAAASGGGKGGGGGVSRAPAKQEPNEFEVAFDPDRKLRSASRAVVPSARSIDSTPMPEGRPMVVIGTINALDPDDARWQRSIATTVNNARDRGLIRKTG